MHFVKALTRREAIKKNHGETVRIRKDVGGYIFFDSIEEYMAWKKEGKNHVQTIFDIG